MTNCKTDDYRPQLGQTRVVMRTRPKSSKEIVYGSRISVLVAMPSKRSIFPLKYVAFYYVMERIRRLTGCTFVFHNRTLFFVRTFAVVAIQMHFMAPMKPIKLRKLSMKCCHILHARKKLFYVYIFLTPQ
jgi:hypothetical protein